MHSVVTFQNNPQLKESFLISASTEATLEQTQGYLLLSVKLSMGKLELSMFAFKFTPNRASAIGVV